MNSYDIWDELRDEYIKNFGHHNEMNAWIDKRIKEIMKNSIKVSIGDNKFCITQDSIFKLSTEGDEALSNKIDEELKKI